MKCISISKTNEYLNSISMMIGEWNQIKQKPNKKNEVTEPYQYKAPSDALEMFCFSRHLAGWLPSGDWNLLQIDNSTADYIDNASLFYSLLDGISNDIDLGRDKSFIFEYSKDKKENDMIKLKIANIIFVFLLFQWHGQLVSSGSKSGEIISLQDGFVYFYSFKMENSNIENMLNFFEEDPLRSPKWIIDILE